MRSPVEDTLARIAHHHCTRRRWKSYPSWQIQEVVVVLPVACPIFEELARHQGPGQARAGQSLTIQGSSPPCICHRS